MIGISKFLGHVSSEVQDLISKLLNYCPEERYSAKQALAHPYFKDLANSEFLENKKKLFNNNIVKNAVSPNLMKSFLNDTDSCIKSTEESFAVNCKDSNKYKLGFSKEKSFLPEIKLNSNFASIEVDAEPVNHNFISTKNLIKNNKTEIEEIHSEVNI